MKKAALIIAGVFLPLLIWCGIHQVVSSYTANPRQAAVQALKEETAKRNAKSLLLAQKANALTENGIQAQLLVEAIRLDKLRVSEKEKRERLKSEEERLHGAALKLKGFFVTP